MRVPDLIRIELKIVGFGGRHEHDAPAGQLDRVVVGGIARVRDNDLIAGLDQCLGQQEERLLPAGRDQNLRLGIRLDAVVPRQLPRDRLA